MLSLLRTFIDENKEYTMTIGGYTGTFWANQNEVFFRLLGPENITVLSANKKIGFYHKEGRELSLDETYHYMNSHPIVGIKLYYRDRKGLAKLDVRALRDNMSVTRGDELTDMEFIRQKQIIIDLMGIELLSEQ